MLKQMINSKVVKAGFDTNVFNARAVLEALLRKSTLISPQSVRLQLYLSPIVLTELSVKLFREGWEDLAIQQFLQEFPFQVLPYAERPAFMVARLVNTEKIPFREHARDLMIGAHYLQEQCIIITENLKHFAWVTLTNVTIQEVMGITEGVDAKESPQLVYTPNQFWTELKQVIE
jgi:predicted nucleic acid-binding protein